MERPLWTPELHRRLPLRFREAARELLLCLNSPVRGSDGRAVTLTPDAVAAVLQQAAFPLFAWADAAWFEAQTVRPPARRSAAQQGQQPGQQQGQQGQQPAAGPPPPLGLAGLAGMMPGAQVVQPGQPMPPIAQVGMWKEQLLSGSCFFVECWVYTKVGCMCNRVCTAPLPCRQLQTRCSSSCRQA